MSKTNEKKGKTDSSSDEGKGLFCFSCGKELCRGNSIDMPRIICPRCGATYAIFSEDGILNFLQLTDKDGHRVADDVMIEYHKRFTEEYKIAKLQKLVKAHLKKGEVHNVEICE